MMKLGIVGCGITGAVTAMLLKQSFPKLSIVILEKSKGTGGRMCTSRSEDGCSVDLGAQFITQTTSLSPTQKECYDSLLSAGLLDSTNGTIEGLKTTPSAKNHFICPKGSGSLVKHFLELSECDVLFNHRVKKIALSLDKWEILCENGSSHEFDAVILTLPVPQILLLDGMSVCLKSDHLNMLKQVKYSSRIALGLFYKEDSSFFKDIPWSSKFISDDPILRYCSFDHKKRNSTGLPSIAIHTTQEFGKSHIDEDPSRVQEMILGRLEKILPELPQPSHIKFHKWRYSQVVQSYDEGKTGCLVVSESPLLMCGGDGFSYSSLEGCILSAEESIRKMKSLSKM